MIWQRLILLSDPRMNKCTLREKARKSQGLDDYIFATPVSFLKLLATNMTISLKVSKSKEKILSFSYFPLAIPASARQSPRLLRKVLKKQDSGSKMVGMYNYRPFGVASSINKPLLTCGGKSLRSSRGNRRIKKTK